MNTFPITTPIIVLVGPTAIGKTALSLDLANEFDCEIISMDSMQVYRHMDIGTAKVTEEERRGVIHHLIDIVEPDEDYDAQHFVRDSLTAIRAISQRGKLPLLTGGTGLYLKALVEGLFDDIGEYPEIRGKLKRQQEKHGTSKLHDELVACDCISAKRIHPNDTHRVLRALEIYHGTGRPWSEHLLLQNKNRPTSRFSSLIQLALTSDRERLYERINQRTQIMLNEGLIEETEKLLNMGFGASLKSMSAIGYRHGVLYLAGETDFDETERTLARDTRRYAKRQYTWFNRNKNLRWFEVSKPDVVKKAITTFLEQRQTPSQP